MTIFSTGRFEALRFEPGNPQFPTLPDGVKVPHLTEFGRIGSPAGNLQALHEKVFSAVPNLDETRFAGWQTLTTWINPALVDFGVIPVAVQRTVTLYNTRPFPVEVTALDLPAGVVLVSPALPVTLSSYGGEAFVLEASPDGEPSFDDFVTFTTDVDTPQARSTGQRVFTIEVSPQRPIVETIRFKSEVLRSTDATEVPYGLLNSPTAHVKYNVRFSSDTQRAKFRNQFMAGSSALVVGAQKWYEARPLTSAATAVDTVLNVSTAYGDFVVNQPVAIYTPAGVSILGTIDSFDGVSITLANALGTAAPAGSQVMPVGLGYVKSFPSFVTYPVNAEDASYTVAFNRQSDVAALSGDFPLLLGLPILEECNEIRQGGGQRGKFDRTEDILDSGLSNRIAYNAFPLGENQQQFDLTLEGAPEIWKWREFLGWLRGSYREFLVPSFRNDLPGVTLPIPSVTFDADDTDLAALAPGSTREALRFEYPDGTIEYRQIATVTDNGTFETITITGGALPAGSPVVSFLQRARIIGDTATLTFERTNFARLKFRYRTVQT